MPSGSYDLGYTPGNTAVGRSQFSPGAVGQGLGSGIDLEKLMSGLWAARQRPQQQDRGPVQRSAPLDSGKGHQNLAEIAHLKTQYGTPGFGGPPLRTVSGPGIIPGGQTLDSMRMTGAQRRAFLPQSADQQGPNMPSQASLMYSTAPREKWQTGVVPPAEDVAATQQARLLQIAMQYPGMAQRMGISAGQQEER